MNRALFFKTLRDYRVLIIILILAIIIFELLAVRMLLEGVKDLYMVRLMLERPFIKTLVRLTFGADLAGDLNATTLATVGLAHPLLWLLCWTLVVTISTGVISGEIGRGTADLLLTLPISRARVYVSTSLVWLLAVIPASFAPLLGLWLGQTVFPLHERLDFGRLWQVSVDFCALNWCIAAVATCVSSLVRRRTTAVGIVMAGLVFSDLVNLLVPFWDAIRPISVLGFLHYFRPLVIVRSGHVPWGDVGTLLGIAIVAWLVGLFCFSRRDVPAA
jgi:ABC-2 type transport system permease protein